jgi:hypothetical protein
MVFKIQKSRKKIDSDEKAGHCLGAVPNTCLGGAGPTEVHRPPGFRNIFAATAASDVHECIRLLNPDSEAIYHCLIYVEGCT